MERSCKQKEENWGAPYGDDGARNKSIRNIQWFLQKRQESPKVKGLNHEIILQCV